MTMISFDPNADPRSAELRRLQAEHDAALSRHREAVEAALAPIVQRSGLSIEALEKLDRAFKHNPQAQTLGEIAAALLETRK